MPTSATGSVRLVCIKKAAEQSNMISSGAGDEFAAKKTRDKCSRQVSTVP